MDIRFKEHLRNIKKKKKTNKKTDKSSPVAAEHLLNNDHNTKSVKFLKNINNNYRELNNRNINKWVTKPAVISWYELYKYTRVYIVLVGFSRWDSRSDRDNSVVEIRSSSKKKVYASWFRAL